VTQKDLLGDILSVDCPFERRPYVDIVEGGASPVRGSHSARSHHLRYFDVRPLQHIKCLRDRNGRSIDFAGIEGIGVIRHIGDGQEFHSSK
jgi:hypothetical protein